MSFEFKLPDLGEGVAEGEIIEWKVAVGDEVEEDQPLVEVMTDKATVEIPSPRAGTIEAITHEAGAIVPVGEVIVVISGEAAPNAAADRPAQKAAATPAQQNQSNAAEPAAATAMAAAPEAVPAVAPSGILATPATRKLARDLGVDLARIVGSGPRGRVTKQDVRNSTGGGETSTVAAPAGPSSSVSTPAQRPAPAPRAIAPGEVQEIPYRGIRKKIGDAMIGSAFTAPHFTLVEEVDMTAIAQLRSSAKAAAAAQGVKLTYLPFIVKALVASIRHHPTLNSELDEDAGVQRVSADVHCGFALDSDRGLMVPVIRNAHALSALEIGAELQRLGEAGRNGSIAREELVGSTISITSAGSVGGLFATPILNHPNAAILGIYRIEDRPVVVDGEVVVRKMMYFSITLDHRIVDGAEAARFMNTMKRLLGDPAQMMLE